MLPDGRAPRLRRFVANRALLGDAGYSAASHLVTLRIFWIFAAAHRKRLLSQPKMLVFERRFSPKPTSGKRKTTAEAVVFFWWRLAGYSRWSCSTPNGVP